jgi:hypothetical protein
MRRAVSGWLSYAMIITHDRCTSNLPKQLLPHQHACIRLTQPGVTDIWLMGCTPSSNYQGLHLRVADPCFTVHQQYGQYIQSMREHVCVCKGGGVWVGACMCVRAHVCIVRTACVMAKVHNCTHSLVLVSKPQCRVREPSVPHVWQARRIRLLELPHTHALVWPNQIVVTYV